MLIRSSASHRYKSAHKRFAKPAIEHFFEEEFPKMFGPNMRSIIADKLIEIFQNNFRQAKTVTPGQILWNAVHKDTRADAPNMKLVPVVLTIINDDDISKLEKGMSITEHKQNLIARICKEAYAQNALLSMRDIELLIACAGTVVSRCRKNYEKQRNETLPHTGNLHDMGSCITHKYQIIYKCVIEKKDPALVASETNHTIKAVSHYLRDFNRVKTLFLDHKTPEYINLVTKLSLHVINQYLKIIDQYLETQKSNDEFYKK
jgi:hypothetical protein